MCVCAQASIFRFVFSSGTVCVCVRAEDRTEQRKGSAHMPVARLSTFLINIQKKTHRKKKKKNNKLGSLSAAVSFPSSHTALLPAPVWPPRYANRYVRISCWIITIHYPLLMSGLILHVHNRILASFPAQC